MSTDEEAIRAVVRAWHKASEAGDAGAVLELMTDDALFLTPGRQPMTKRRVRSPIVANAGSRTANASDIAGDSGSRSQRRYRLHAVSPCNSRHTSRRQRGNGTPRAYAHHLQTGRRALAIGARRQPSLSGHEVRPNQSFKLTHYGCRLWTTSITGGEH